MANNKNRITSSNEAVAKKIEKNIEASNSWYIKIMLAFIFISGIAYFGISLVISNEIVEVIFGLLMLVFTLLFVWIIGTNYFKKKKLVLLTIFVLLVFQLIGIGNILDIFNIQSNKMIDFTNKSLTEVIEWTSNNKIDLVQEYEYSDMIDKYYVISQDIEEGTNLDKVKELTVAISEGPSPYKEIVLPNMVDWDVERVLNFIKTNHLTNVLVEFVSSDKNANTLIEQSKSGNIKRNDELKLTFTYGESRDYSEVKLKNLVDMSEFEAEFYLKQYGIDYEIKYDFSNKIKRGNVMAQSVKAGEKISIVDGEKLVITISKGKEIKVLDLANMSVSEITNWIIQNKLRLEIKSRYDDSKDENEVIEVNYKKGDVVEEGTTITVTISKGHLKMKDFKDLSEFREWADKNGIIYEEQHEFSDDVKAGEVISYSYKKGEVLKNNDPIIVKISDGKKTTVPNLKGMSKSDIINKLKDLGLNYNFVYKNSSSVSKDKAISQSISAGSEVAAGTTITITLSNGKASSQNKEESSNDSNSNVPSTPTCDTSKGDILNIQAGSSGAQTKSMIQSMNPNHKFSWNMVSACPNGDMTPGNVCTVGLDGTWKNFCDTILITIVQ